MTIAVKTALLRFLRVMAAAAVTAGVEYLLAHLGSWHLPPLLFPIIMALLTALDKLLRERGKA